MIIRTDPVIPRDPSCQDCEECLSKCPQQIRIPNQLSRIVQTLRVRKA